MNNATTASDLQPLLDLADKYKDVPSDMRIIRKALAFGNVLHAREAASRLPHDVLEQLPQFVFDWIYQIAS